MKKGQIIEKFKLIICIMLVYMFVFMNQFALARYVKSREDVVTLKFKKAVVDESEIIYTPILEKKGVEVEITTETKGDIKYKLDEEGNWNNYSEKFCIDKDTKLFTKIAFSDGDGPETSKNIELFYYGEYDESGNAVAYYKNLSEALSSKKNENTIKPLYEDCSENADIIIPTGENLTLDLNGKELNNISITNKRNFNYKR